MGNGGSDLSTLSDREILEANNLRLRVIQRELQSVKLLLIGLITACIGFVAAVVILSWLG
jgi:hypothetical protein